MLCYEPTTLSLITSQYEMPIRLCTRMPTKAVFKPGETWGGDKAAHLLAKVPRKDAGWRQFLFYEHCYHSAADKSISLPSSAFLSYRCYFNGWRNIRFPVNISSFQIVQCIYRTMLTDVSPLQFNAKSDLIVIQKTNQNEETKSSKANLVVEQLCLIKGCQKRPTITYNPCRWQMKCLPKRSIVFKCDAVHIRKPNLYNELQK